MKNTPKRKRLLSYLMTLTVIMSTFPAQAATGEVRTVGSLPQGSIVYDPTWIWEYKTGDNYTGTGTKKQVEWIVVAQNHYTNPTAGTVIEAHTTLISKENVGKLAFDNSNNRESLKGSNNWGNSGTPNATIGARTWLNGIFHNSMPTKLQNSIQETTLPNKTYAGANYTTTDKVFIPTMTEVAGSSASLHPIGRDWGYFTDHTSRVVPELGQYNYHWLRSPGNQNAIYNGVVIDSGNIGSMIGNDPGYVGVRPTINIKASTTVREVGTGRYELIYNSPPELTITNPIEQTINASGSITISGTVKDVDNDKVTITATINGITKSTVVSNTSIEQEWSLSWTGAELAEGIANTTTVQATDSPTG